MISEQNKAAWQVVQSSLSGNWVIETTSTLNMGFKAKGADGMPLAYSDRGPADAMCAELNAKAVCQ